MWNRPEVAHGLIVFLGDAGALAGDQRRGNLAAFAGKTCADAGRDERAEMIDGSPSAQIPWRLACAFERLDLADGITRRPQTVEPGFAPEVEAIGRDRLRRRPERGFQRDRLAALDSCLRRRQRHAHPMRCLCRRQVAERDHPERDPGPCLVAALVELDKALHRHPAHLLGEHWRAGHLGVELGIGEACGKRKRRAADDQAEASSPAGEDEPSRRHDQSCCGEQARLF